MSRPRTRLWMGIASFLLPGALFLAICAAMGFAPFGDSSILIFDLSDQFVEFLCALKEGDVFFSWNTALGGSYIGTFSYYVSSPFSLLTLLCPNEAMPMAVVFLIALKLCCAGLTFFLLLGRRTGRYDLTGVAFSLCYALMAYNMAYSMSFMWLDGVLWLPILLMGVEDILDNKSARLLVAALAVSFVSSWYISYMTGLFCALYLLWRCVCEVVPLRTTLTNLWRLILRAGLALLLTAWLWLPTALAMFGGKLAQSTTPLSVGFNWPITTLFYKLFSTGAYDSVTYTGSAFLYCSVPAVLLALVWPFLPGRTKRARWATGIMAAVLVLSLWLSPLDAVWHLFQAPNSFPGRWAFVVSCFILLLGYDSLLQLLKPLSSTRLLTLLLTVVLAVDMGANGLTIFRRLDEELGFESYSSYHDYKVQMGSLVDQINADEGFSRAVSDVGRSRNEPAAFGYKGIDFFSSSYDANVNRVLRSFGLTQRWFWVTDQGSTPVTDLLLGVNYHISDGTMPPWYTPVAQSGELTLYRGNLTAAPGYFTDSELFLHPNWCGTDGISAQTRTLSALSGEDEAVFTQIGSTVRTDEEFSTTWTFTSDGNPIYGRFVPVEDHDALLYVNGVPHGEIYTSETDCLLYLGTFFQGTTVEVTLITTAPAERRVEMFWELDTAVLTRAAERLEQRALQVTDYSSGYLAGTVTADTDGWLYTSIPAQPGWTVRVDGQVVEHTALDDALILAPLTAGEHTVSFTYTPPGLYVGLGLTGIGLALCLWLLLRKKK
ncbi:MAG: hypothetical protein E7450_03785 [Ruminococcaceae bacterium]|nr:hypothetical protein [Oscillospiraceae bacterium]